MKKIQNGKSGKMQMRIGKEPWKLRWLGEYSADVSPRSCVENKSQREVKQNWGPFLKEEQSQKVEHRETGQIHREWERARL